MEFDVQLERGLFQGDSLLPLLFCLCTNPITSMLLGTEGYQCLHAEEPIMHLFYVDDFKLFARNSEALGRMTEMVIEGSHAIGISVGWRTWREAEEHLSET